MSKTILITGASTGFGRDTAETLARAGHTVFASMRDPQAKNSEHAAALRKQGIEVVALDVSDDGSVERAVAEVMARAKQIDVLINNAGIASAGVTEAFTADQAKAVFNTNVVGLLRISRAVLPGMRAHGQGLIINIGSILGRVTFPFFGIYGASKFAVEALTDSLRTRSRSSASMSCWCSQAPIPPRCMRTFRRPPILAGWRPTARWGRFPAPCSSTS